MRKKKRGYLDFSFTEFDQIARVGSRGQHIDVNLKFLCFFLGKDGKKRIRVNRDLFNQGCVNTLEEGLSSAQKIGFPVMIKVCNILPA